MLKTILFAFSLASIAAAPASAAPCKDAKGRFVKCPAAAPAKPVKCKDAKGKFAKCGTPGAKPIKKRTETILNGWGGEPMAHLSQSNLSLADYGLTVGTMRNFPRGREVTGG